MKLALIAGLVFIAGMPLQVKQPQACDHAAPPAGMQWICSSQNPCECHLAPSGSHDRLDEGISKAPSSDASAGCVSCRIVSFAIPAYPEAARRGQKQGIVTASLVLNADGTVNEVRIESGDPQLAGAVEAALRQWRFTPGGRAETIPVSVQFVLAEDVAGGVTGKSLLNTVVIAKPSWPRASLDALVRR